MKEIIFTPVFTVDKNFYPQPSIKNIPEWYKSTDSYINSNKFDIIDGNPNSTIKKCMPVFDSMTAGYILKTYVDIYVKKDQHGVPIYYWPNYDAISFHVIDQAKHHPQKSIRNNPYPKWNSAWSIKTPKGYSCLFIPPMHNPNPFFTILPGIVDTDQYFNPVNFPFILNDENFEGIIPAGTSICQVIPFKRDEFQMKIGNRKQIKKIRSSIKSFRSKWKNEYRDNHWQRKKYL